MRRLGQGHVLGSSGGAPSFRQQQFLPFTQPMYDALSPHGSLNEKERQRAEAQHAATQSPKLAADASHEKSSPPRTAPWSTVWPQRLPAASRSSVPS